MDTDLTSSDFWTSDEVTVIRPPHLKSGDDPANWAAGQVALTGHLLFRTSGSEGSAKWVALSRESLLYSALAVNEHLQITENDVWAVALPLYHVGGFGIFSRAYLSRSSVRILEGHWSPRGFHELLHDESITLSSLVPTQLYDLVSIGMDAPPKLRALLVGGDALGPILAEDARKLGWPVLKTYGMTECASQVATQFPGDAVDALPAILPIWNVECSEAGHLRVKGRALASGYVIPSSDSEGWAWEPFTEEWFSTRDHGEVVLDGDSRRLDVKGRALLCIKIKGELVNLQNIRASLAEFLPDKSHPFATVAARSHSRDGSELVVVVAGSADFDEDRLQQWLASQPTLTRPVEIVRVDRIPRNALGKLDEGRLKTLARPPRILRRRR